MDYKTIAVKAHANIVRVVKKQTKGFLPIREKQKEEKQKEIPRSKERLLEKKQKT